VSLTSSMVSSRNFWPRRLKTTGRCRPLATRIILCILIFILALLSVNNQTNNKQTYPEHTLSRLSYKAINKPTYCDPHKIHPEQDIYPLKNYSCRAILHLLRKAKIIEPDHFNNCNPHNYSDIILCKDAFTIEDTRYVPLHIKNICFALGHRGDLLGKGPYQGCAINKFPPRNITLRSYLPFMEISCFEPHTIKQKFYDNNTF
jgi:hypothetical protein